MSEVQLCMYFLADAAMKTSESGCALCFTNHMRQLSSCLGSQNGARARFMCHPVLIKASAECLSPK